MQGVRALVLAAALLAGLGASLRAREALAQVTYQSPYTFEQTFGTGIRLVRVDLGCKITEKDADSGYILFEYTTSESPNRVHRGSLQAVRSKTGAQVVVQLASLPQYHEQMIVDALARKLVVEHGEPPAREKAPAPQPSEDGGADGST
jgi:hypothetical protein